jgi:hypothetical protein
LTAKDVGNKLEKEVSEECGPKIRKPIDEYYKVRRGDVNDWFADVPEA